MKVTAIDRFFVDVPFREVPERNMARFLNGWHVSEVCRVETDAGLVGVGETLPNYTWGVVTPSAVDRTIGRNPFEAMWDDSLGAGLQMALFDVAGKAAGVPCYRLMGQKVRDWCPIAWWSIDMPARDFAIELKDAVAAGYVASKQKARPWFDVFAQVAADREVIPAHFTLDLDFNGLLVNAGNAVPVVKSLDECPNVSIYESPIPQGDVEGNRRIRRSTRCAIAMHHGSPPVMTAVREQVCDGFVVGGGASAVLRQSRLAHEANMPFWLQLVGTGLTTVFAMHLGAVCSHAQWPAVTCVNMYQHQLLRVPLEVKGGYIRVPETPGLGIELDEDACERMRASSSERPNQRAVYSVHRPNGDQTYYLSERQYWDDYAAGNLPVAEPGTTLDALRDDGSAAWTDLQRRVQGGPVRSHGA